MSPQWAFFQAITSEDLTVEMHDNDCKNKKCDTQEYPF